MHIPRVVPFFILDFRQGIGNQFSFKMRLVPAKLIGTKSGHRIRINVVERQMVHFRFCALRGDLLLLFLQLLRMMPLKQIYR